MLRNGPKETRVFPGRTGNFSKFGVQGAHLENMDAASMVSFFPWLDTVEHASSIAFPAGGILLAFKPTKIFIPLQRLSARSLKRECRSTLGLLEGLLPPMLRQRATSWFARSTDLGATT